MDRTFSTDGDEMRNVYTNTLLKELPRNRPRGRHAHRWEDDDERDLDSNLHSSLWICIPDESSKMKEN
jgi:hypothetical protein